MACFSSVRPTIKNETEHLHDIVRNSIAKWVLLIPDWDGEIMIENTNNLYAAILKDAWHDFEKSKLHLTDDQVKIRRLLENRYRILVSGKKISQEQTMEFIILIRRFNEYLSKEQNEVRVCCQKIKSN